MPVKAAAKTFHPGKTHPVDFKRLVFVEEDYLRRYQQFSDFALLAALIIVVSEHGHDRHLADAQIVDKPFGLRRQSEVRQVAAKRKDVGLLRNLFEDALKAVAGILVHVQVADRSDAQLIRFSAHSHLRRHPQIPVPSRPRYSPRPRTSGPDTLSSAVSAARTGAGA